MEKEVKQQIVDLDLKNVELISHELSFSELRVKMLECHLSLGQFEDNPRLKRTIPHKAFESLNMVTAKAGGIMEILEDGENCLMVNLADSRDLADKILTLKNNSELMTKLIINGVDLFKKRFSIKIIVEPIMRLM